MFHVADRPYRKHITSPVQTYKEEGAQPRNDLTQTCFGILPYNLVKFQILNSSRQVAFFTNCCTACNSLVVLT